MTTKKQKELNYFLDLPWTFEVEQENDPVTGKIYIVRVSEWPRVVTDASTIQQAFKEISEVLTSVIILYLEKGYDIPEPQHQKLFKGNIAYRTTSERHYRIAREAKKRNLSLSQLIDNSIDGDLRESKKS